MTVQTQVDSGSETSLYLNSSFGDNIDSSDYMPTPENTLLRRPPNTKLNAKEMEMLFRRHTFERTQEVNDSIYVLPPEMLLLRRRIFETKFNAKEVDDSVYKPSPEMTNTLQKKFNTKEVALPRQLFLGETSHLCDFVQSVNKVLSCKTTHCQGKLIATSFKLKGLGGTIIVTYNCSECGLHPIEFTTNKPIKDSTRSEVATALQVAFIISGGMHATYRRVIHHGLGMEAFGNSVFASVIESLYSVVKQMVDDLCEEAKAEMKLMDPDALGSWKKAITSADGCWHTRGHHSQNHTFTVRNYQNGSLLYYIHLCQRGRDELSETPLYQGTSKSAEAYGANVLFGRAKSEGMVVAIQWQDGDSSSSNEVKKHFPDAEVMICAGHVAKSHKKVLEGYAKMKSFSTVFSNSHKKKHPDVTQVKCHCDGRHSQTCGCLTPAFVETARNNMSQLLKDSKSADDFKAKVEALSRHAHDEHQWEGGQCDFHPLRLCSCGKCDEGEELNCKGTLYHTRLCLTCPLHKLAYEIKLDNRGSKAEQYIHSVLKKGNSNLLEASHNVFIRFREKALNLERLHYETSTNLALLQANLSYMTQKHGSTYHWIPELFKQMQLPVYDGLADKLQIYSKNRTKSLKYRKTEKVKKRRIQLKCERVREAQTRKEWSAKRGNFDYYGADEEIVGKSEGETNKACICGSKSHMRTNHKDCPLNKKNQPQPQPGT